MYAMFVYLSSEIVYFLLVQYFLLVWYLVTCGSVLSTENSTTSDVKFHVGIARINVPTVLPLVLLTASEKVNTAVMLVVKCTRVLHMFFQVCLRVLL